MKIITQNLHCFAEENYLVKFQQIAQFIVDNDIDVACFQEVAQHVKSPMISDELQLKEGNAALLIRDMIKDFGGDSYELLYSFAHYYYETDEEGVAILTRLPIKDWKEHIISDEKKYTIDRRTAIEIQLENNVSLSTLHLGIASDKEVKSPALKQFLTLKEITKGKQKLFFGDYNIPDTTSAYDEIIQSGCVDLCGKQAKENPAFLTTPGTIDGWKNDKGAKRLDYGFVEGSIQVNEARVIFDGKNEPIVSDHFGLYFDVEI